LAFVLLALLPRLVIVLASKDDLYGKPRVEPMVFIGEEIARGNMANDILEGPLLPVSGYQYAHFFGGSVVAGLLAVPSFVVFGRTLFALKLVPIICHLIALVFLFLILDRYVSRLAALLAATLFALSPPGYTLLTTVCWGSHMESAALALASVWVFMRLHETNPNSLPRRFGWGILAGFSVYFGYQCLLFVGALSLFDLARDRRILWSRAMLVQVIAFVIGFLPWITYNVENDFAGLHLYGRSIVDHMAEEPTQSATERFTALIVEDLPEAFFFDELAGIPGVAINSALALLAAIALACSAWHLRGRMRQFVLGLVRGRGEAGIVHPGAIALVYLTLFLIGFALSDFEIGKEPKDIAKYRYAMPPFPFFLLAAGVGLHALQEKLPRLAKPTFAAAAVVGVLCLIGCGRFCDRDRFMADWETPGYKPDTFGLWVAVRYSERFDVLEDVIARAEAKRTPQQREVLYRGMGKLLRGFGKKPAAGRAREEYEQFERTRAFLREHVPAEYRHHFEELQAGKPRGG